MDDTILRRGVAERTHDENLLTISIVPKKEALFHAPLRTRWHMKLIRVGIGIGVGIPMSISIAIPIATPVPTPTFQAVRLTSQAETHALGASNGA
jgi:hypothetical protein